MDKFLDPNEVLKKLKLKEDMKAADFGSGSGGWTVPLAKVLSAGKVWALDISEEALSALKAKAQSEKIANIETLNEDVERGTSLPAGEMDLALLTNVLYECYDKHGVMEEVKRVLKPGGKMLIVDWIKDSPLTREIDKVSFDNIRYFAKELGLKIEEEFPAGAYHLAMILVK
jgi:ubiquinone/menaquinone biosynthesis C-methylase UbiE